MSECCVSVNTVARGRHPIPVHGDRRYPSILRILFPTTERPVHSRQATWVNVAKNQDVHLPTLGLSGKQVTTGDPTECKPLPSPSSAQIVFIRRNICRLAAYHPSATDNNTALLSKNLLHSPLFSANSLSSRAHDARLFQSYCDEYLALNSICSK